MQWTGLCQTVTVLKSSVFSFMPEITSHNNLTEKCLWTEKMQHSVKRESVYRRDQQIADVVKLLTTHLIHFSQTHVFFFHLWVLSFHKKRRKTNSDECRWKTCECGPHQTAQGFLNWSTVFRRLLCGGLSQVCQAWPDSECRTQITGKRFRRFHWKYCCWTARLWKMKCHLAKEHCNWINCCHLK